MELLTELTKELDRTTTRLSQLDAERVTLLDQQAKLQAGIAALTPPEGKTISLDAKAITDATIQLSWPSSNATR